MSSAGWFGASFLSLRLLAAVNARCWLRGDACADGGGPAIAGSSPELFGNSERIELVLGPPRGLIAAPVKRAVVQSAQWDRELVAHAAAERCGLRKAEVMGVGGPPAAEQARLQGHELEVRAVAVPARFGQAQVGFVDPRHARALTCSFFALDQGKGHGAVQRQSAGVWL
jgi:hypothetical protein